MRPVPGYGAALSVLISGALMLGIHQRGDNSHEVKRKEYTPCGSQNAAMNSNMKDMKVCFNSSILVPAQSFFF